MILLPGLLFILWGEPARCLAEGGGFDFYGEIRQYTVATNTVYVATEEKLYQLNHDLTLVRSVTQRGIVKSGEQFYDALFHRVSETDQWSTTFRVNVLLPFVENDTLISCGVIDRGCGVCELLDLEDISNVLHRELISVGPQRRNSSASVGFLVNVEKTRTETETYILTAIQPDKKNHDKNHCPSSKPVNLHNTNNNQMGSIFSTSADGYSTIHVVDSVEFVDGFQLGFIMYLFSNLPSSDKSNKVRLIWLEGKTSKTETFKSLWGATLSISDGGRGSRLEASSVIPGGPPVLWSGVFSVDEGRTNTELVLFDISPDLTGEKDEDPDFCLKSDCTLESTPQPKMLKPKKVLFRQNYMTSVLAVRQKAWVVFLIGTGDGQLIKLAVDKNYHTTCPKVLYRANDDRKVLPKMHLDPVDLKHVYVPFQNQIKRVAVSNCSTYTNVEDCWSAQDPYCVWCGSKGSCTFEDDCPGSDWLSIPDDSQQKMISHQVTMDNTGQSTLTIQTHVTAGSEALANFACQFSTSSSQLCIRNSPPPQFPQCTCILTNSTLPAEGMHVTVKIRLGKTRLTEPLKISNCADIIGPPTSVLCRQCIEAGCGWNINRCSWANQGERNDSLCQKLDSGMNISRPEISSITPSVISFYGKNNAVLSGHNLHDVTRVRIQADMDCTPQESPVWSNTGDSLTFHIPSADNKGVVKVCVVLPDGSCHGSATITYRSSPSCTNFTPNTSWISGKREITVTGSHLDFVEGVVHNHAPHEVRSPKSNNSQNLTYDTPAAKTSGIFISLVSLKVANQTLACSPTIIYHPDPEFISFTAARTGDDVRVTIQKKADKLNMKMTEIEVWGVRDEKQYPCIMENLETSNNTDSFTCEISKPPDAKFQKLLIVYGDKEVTLTRPSSVLYFLMLLVLLLIPCIIVLVIIVYRRKQMTLTAKMNKYVEDMELDIRNDIRQGFVDLQTEKADLMENVGAIPFLDFKHFASRIFFPESESMMASCIKDIGQDAVQVQLDECCQGLSRLIQDQLFLTSMVHAMEEQKSFTIKDKCALASLLTVALHNNLTYLTEIMEVLLRDLMQQNSNTQPKLLLRRTESVVEKLLTNWMSICLYGFLRESAGQHLFLMVSALTQQTAKGPVDCVTEKALYTLSEDWLLWQAQDFSSLKLKVLFAVGSDGEVSEPLEVNALSCDTVEQVKEKILSTFKAKFGFPYNTALRDVRIEYEQNGSFVPLEEVDASSEVIGEVTMLNTLKHYKVPDGATIKVLSKKTHPPLSPQGSVKDDENFSGKYFHLIDPDVEEDQRKNPERKKLKLKEVHLTKLLSTKVAVHSYVENLFRSIWGMPNCRAPHAVKYFFDFLDAQADNMKITDPDVLHIWKTNSLPLRFWVNIMKNPQFVFDMEKSPNLDGCLNVIAQAFMDSFSLSEIQLGKYAPTNKLLYAKDIPKFKQEVKAYYKQVREQPPITVSEFKGFLQEESKKHESEFNDAAALKEIYKFIERYFTEITDKLDQNGAPTELKEQLHHVKDSFDGLKSCAWN
ncbi:plexin-C1 isoform X1 [Sparus aurata]|uniref:plexin-C1 isoform X1 n=1 Tax=Sparus aurata TaxID=8175 RepID=UPI0011C191E4|nr:plexin-C1 isoform X1 [Sparus aurata]XP_030295682.1 plexin-C1 isoform X1 [Sparus aurata]XP_030295683.1 plexin-C1 isoform X1 [Sparus aurata]